MKIKLYTIYDIELQEAGPIFQANNHKIAKRNYINAVKNAEFINCLDLYFIGVFDNEKMIVEDVHNELIATGSGVVKSLEEKNE